MSRESGGVTGVGRCQGSREVSRELGGVKGVGGVTGVGRCHDTDPVVSAATAVHGVFSFNSRSFNSGNTHIYSL